MRSFAMIHFCMAWHHNHHDSITCCFRKCYKRLLWLRR